MDGMEWVVGVASMGWPLGAAVYLLVGFVVAAAIGAAEGPPEKSPEESLVALVLVWPLILLWVVVAGTPWVIDHAAGWLSVQLRGATGGTPAVAPGVVDHEAEAARIRHAAEQRWIASFNAAMEAKRDPLRLGLTSAGTKCGRGNGIWCDRR